MKTTKLSANCILIILLCAFSAGCDKPTKDKPSEKPTVQGRWSGLESGTTEMITLSFTSNRFAYFDARSNEIGSGTFVANETVQPMQMDLTFEKIPAPEYVGKVGLAIYEFQGSDLKIAGCEPGSKQRPTNLVSSPGVRVFTFKHE